MFIVLHSAFLGDFAFLSDTGACVAAPRDQDVEFRRFSVFV